MTINQAIAEIRAGIMEGIRGVGTATINMADERCYHLVHAHGPPMLARYSSDGELAEQLPADEIVGDVAHVSWRVDELGGILL